MRADLTTMGAMIIRLLKNQRVQIGLMLGLALAGLAFAPMSTSRQGSQERFFRVEAGNFEYSPAILKVNEGDRVTIELASQDVAHGLEIDGYGLEIHTDPGQTERVSFVANRAGSFRIRCSVTCGSLHPFMTGQLKVGANTLLWKMIGGALLAAIAGWRMAAA